MKARTILGAAALGAVCMVIGLSISPDLRGWPSESGSASSPVFKATAAGRPDFGLPDCTAWTVDLYASPKSSEYAGTATETVVTCRSRSSLIMWLGLYSALAALALLFAHEIRRGRARKALKGSS